MSTFTLNSITIKGLNVIAKLVAGSTLEFTRIAVGDGAMPSDKTPLTVTDLTHKLFDVTINSVVSDGNGSATVMGIFSNKDRETGFFYRELGLFAKDPDTKAEFLYCYGNAAEDAEWISPSGASSVIEKEVSIVTLVGNAETVTATIKSGIYATKEEMNNKLALKADLDTTGGRVLAAQMRFDADQTLYVDAAAADGGDGTQLKPFKTIQAAINARYKGAPVVYIRIKAGTYKENISIPRSPGTTWRLIREGTGTVAINTVVVDNCTYVVFDNLTFNGPATDNSTIIYVANTASANFNAVTVNGASNATGVNFSTSRGIIRSSVFNNCGLAIAATDGAYLDLKNNSGTNNTRGIQADGAVVVCDWYVPAATTPYEKVNGGTINVEGGDSSFPSNFGQLYNLSTVSALADLKTKILAEHGKLKEGETRFCRFWQDISGGLGPFGQGQTMHMQIHKTSADGKGYGVVLFFAHRGPASAYMQIENGAFLQNVPVNLVDSNDIASAETYGLVRIAEDTDLLNDDDYEAAITPAVYHDVSDFRHKSTAYKVGDKVECMFNFELFLECTQAGTTSSGQLDTRNVTHGQVLTDGTVKWTVRTHIKSVNNTVADASGNINITTVNTANKVIQGTQYYLQSGNGDVNESTAIAENKVNLVIGSWYSTGFRDLCSEGTPITVAINHRNGNIKTIGSISADGGFKGNADSATKAIQDKNGLQIDTNYLKLTGGIVNGYVEVQPPDISESNNKVPTTFWVKTYAPSRTGEGASGNWNINADSSDVAKKVDLNGNSREIIEFGAADKYENEAISDNAANTIITSWNSIGFKTSADNGDNSIKLAIGTRTGNVETKGNIKAQDITANGYMYALAPAIDESNNKVPTTFWVRTYAPSRTGENASGNWGINITGKAATATNADVAKKLDLIGNSRETIENGAADNSESEAISANTANTIITSWNSIGFKTSADVSDKSIKLAIGTRTGNVETKGNIKAQDITANGYMYALAPAIDESNNKVPTTFWVRSAITKCALTDPDFTGTPTAPTPPNGTNNTQIATAEFVRNSIQRVAGKATPTLTALINWDSMKSANGGTDVRTLKNPTYGITAYGGDASALNEGNIILKQAFNTFDALLIEFTTDNMEQHDFNLIPMWLLNKKFNTMGFFDLLHDHDVFWRVRGSSCPTRPSTTTRFNVWKQNCGMIEIYGVTY